ncbi:AzlD domain-containing protein [Saccharopolyspora sp. NPDC047091]|uniref:branched-chain amino acid transporter permease n=1 Tax=Saccharopolyspora sp. NPDC047091 TaxID=3155924 RepID=UPI0033DFEF9B
MPETSYLVAVVAVCAAVTWAVRALPFAALAPLRDSELVHHLGQRMPVGVMIVLAVYTVRGTTVPQLAPVGLALAATLGLHLWRGNALLSILGGTAVHVLLVSTAFAFV